MRKGSKNAAQGLYNANSHREPSQALRILMLHFPQTNELIRHFWKEKKLRSLVGVFIFILFLVCFLCLLVGSPERPGFPETMQMNASTPHSYWCLYPLWAANAAELCIFSVCEVPQIMIFLWCSIIAVSGRLQKCRLIAQCQMVGVLLVKAVRGTSAELFTI